MNHWKVETLWSLVKAQTKQKILFLKANDITKNNRSMTQAEKKKAIRRENDIVCVTLLPLKMHGPTLIPK